MPKPGCPAWNYDKHPARGHVLKRESLEFLMRLLDGEDTVENTVFDIRPTHDRFFHDLTFPGYEYYAGNYRGSRDCLIDYEVQVAGDPRVGWPSALVEQGMDDFGGTVRDRIGAIDVGWGVPNSILPEHEKLKFVVALCARAFVHFLEIHPFADGNGHMGRAIIRTILARFGYFPDTWHVEPRPPDPPYSDLIVQYRNGYPEPLEAEILGDLV